MNILFYNNGNNCNFAQSELELLSHRNSYGLPNTSLDTSSVQVIKPQQIYRFIQNCKYGDNCRNSHIQFPCRHGVDCRSKS